MANQTITTAVNYDAAAIGGLLNGETITCNAGGALTINADVRWNQQAAVFGTITMNSSSTLLVDGTQIWQIPFSASTGNVPTQGALGTNGVTGGTSGATGELTRVWATGSLTPAAAGGAMPATGYIKLRSKTGNFQNGETITLPGGATITASGVGQRSWIHVVGTEAALLQIGSLTGSYDFNGDWYELGTTDGTDDQTFQFPVADHCPVLWIETSAGSGVYECWLNAGSRWGTATQFIPTTGERGKWFGIDIATGVITIARRATNACGTKPPSGCKVRIGNIILSNSSSANWDANTFPTNTEQRYRLQLNFPYNASKITSNWFHNVQRGNLTDSGVSHALNGGTNMTRVGVGIAAAITAVNNATSVAFFNSVKGCSWTDVRIGGYGRSGQAIVAYVGVNNVVWTRVRVDCFADIAATTRSAAMRWVNFNGCNNITIDDYTTVGTETIFISCTNGSVNNHKYADLMIGTTVVSGGQNAVTLQTNCINFNISGFSEFDGLANVHPYSGVYNIESFNGVSVTNVGSAVAPYNCGTANVSRYVVRLGPGETALIRRVYMVNPADNIQLSNGVVRSIQLINVWGNGTVVSNWNSTDGAVVRGCRFGNFQTPVGQAGGWFFNDVLSSDTAGAIDAIFAPATTSPVSSGQMTQVGNYLKNIGDTMTVEMDYFSLGHTGFTSVISGLTNQTVEFQYDLGSGYNGSWLAATTANVIAIGAINPATGIKLKVRTTATAANAVNGLIRFVTSTTSSAAQTQYPLPGSLISVTNLIPQSRVKVYRVDTGAFLAQAFSGAGTSVSFDIAYTGSVRVEARNASGVTTYKPWSTQVSISPTATTNVIALQETD